MINISIIWAKLKNLDYIFTQLSIDHWGFACSLWGAQDYFVLYRDNNLLSTVDQSN